MAKKNPFKKMQQDIHALKLANADDLSGDYKFTNNQMGAIFGNLATTGKSLGRTLTATQGRELAAMQRLASRGSKQAARGLGAARGQVRSQFGSAVGAGGADIFGVAKATAAASGTQSKAALGAGKMLAAGGQVALGAARAGASEAAAGAQYAIATALKSRAQQDAASIAEHQLALDQLKLDARLKRNEFDRQRKLAMDDADKATETQNKALYAAAAPVLATYGTKLDAWMADDANKDLTFADFWKANGLDPADPAYGTAYPAMARAFAMVHDNGMSAGDAIQQAMGDLYAATPGYDPTTMNSVISTGLETNSMDRLQMLLSKGIDDLTTAEKHEANAISASMGLGPVIEFGSDNPTPTYQVGTNPNPGSTPNTGTFAPPKKTNTGTFV